MWACKNCHCHVVAYLLNEGSADVTVRMKDDSNAFDWAVLGGDETTMELLAAHLKVDIQALNKFGCAAVQWAAAAGNVGNVQVVTWQRHRFESREHGAARRDRQGGVEGHDDCLEWLLHDEEGPKLTWRLQMRDLDGRTVAELAAMNGQQRTASGCAVSLRMAKASLELEFASVTFIQVKCVLSFVCNVSYACATSTGTSPDSTPVH